MAEVQLGESGPRARTLPHIVPGRRPPRFIGARVANLIYCRGCGFELAAVYADTENRTFLLIGTVRVRQAELVCACGAVRHFHAQHSSPVAGLPVDTSGDADTLPITE